MKQNLSFGILEVARGVGDANLEGKSRVNHTQKYKDKIQKGCTVEDTFVKTKLTRREGGFFHRQAGAKPLDG